MVEYIKKNSVPDRKGPDGLWVSTLVVPMGAGELSEYHTTRGSILWNNLVKRCRVGGVHQKDRPSYIGVTNNFIDKQSFITWCQDQHGYMKKDETGKFWQLDKDIISIGNMSYSPETCCFVPHRINMSLNTTQGARGSTPIGTRILRNGSIAAQHKDKHLGCFNTLEEAHKAWQLAAANTFRLLAEDEALGKVVQKGLINRAEYLENDCKLGIITEFKSNSCEGYEISEFAVGNVNTGYQSVNVV